MLLVVDNCEHVIGASASLLQELLQAAPRLRILATSREPLRSDGERIFLVPPLSVPGAEEAPPPDRALTYESVRLFAERAQAAQPSFVLSTSNCQARHDICRHLDGMPLAIELAAARVRALSIGQIAARLDDCLRVLGRGHRTELPRHQTLRAAIDWSYDLLDRPRAPTATPVVGLRRQLHAGSGRGRGSWTRRGRRRRRRHS